MTDNIYEKLSAERKTLQAADLLPSFMSTGGWQMFKEKYLYDAKTPREQYERIARTAAHHTDNPKKWEVKFFELMWKGWLSLSTPVLSNTGTDRGLPVSCSGQYIEDSIDGFYSARRETAILTKHGFGTAGYLGDIRPRGSLISTGGKASGVLPVLKGFIQDMREVSQGSARRGAWAGYLPIDHGDFSEVCKYVENYPDDANIGWVVTDEFIARLESGDTDAVTRFQKAMKCKMVTGKGYFLFIDKVNRQRPQAYVDHDLYVRTSQLCTEIFLFNDKDHTYTCVLSSMNTSLWHEWRNTDAVFTATVFLDCIAAEFIERARHIPGLEKAVRFTEKGRALGLGQCGFATLLQKEMIPFESFEAHMLNNEIAKHIWDESLKASKWMAKEWGEPEWCKGTGVRNTHRLAVAPTKSTSLIMGGVSEGIGPDMAMVFTQSTPAGEIARANPVFLELMKKKRVYDKTHLQEIVDAQGSCQHVSWLTDEEKAVFKTAFEINQEAILRLAGARQRWIDQGQSLNLFFSAEEDEEYIADIHRKAFLDENILTLYYVYSKAGVQASRGEQCLACM